MVHTGRVSNSNSYGQPAAPQGQGDLSAHDRGPTTSKKSGRWWKILLAVAVVIAILLALAEFGLRVYTKNAVVDEFRSSAEEEGLELSEDPSVSFGASPLLLGLAQGNISTLNVTMPSTLDVSYEDSDQSRPVVSGQPEMRVNASDMSMDTDNPVVSEITVDTVLPPEFLLAEIQKSEAEGGEDAAAEEDLLSGLIEVSDVRMNPDDGTMDLDITGGLASLSMTPVVQDGALNFEVESLSILGIELPESLVDQLTEELQQTVNDVDEMEIQSVDVTEEGLSIRMHGQDVQLNEISVNAGLSQDGEQGSGQGDAQDS